MQTILAIIEKAGGFRPSLFLKIDNAPYMELVIEAVGEPGPSGLPAISVCHYGVQNGDLMRDPEMCFELTPDGNGTLSLNPYYWRNDYVAIEQWSRTIVRGHYVELSELHKQHKSFARTWDKNLCHQGFRDAFQSEHIQS